MSAYLKGRFPMNKAFAAITAAMILLFTTGCTKIEQPIRFTPTEPVPAMSETIPNDPEPMQTEPVPDIVLENTEPAEANPPQSQATQEVVFENTENTGPVITAETTETTETAKSAETEPLDTRVISAPHVHPQGEITEIPYDKVIYLTFDDGPGKDTERLLDILDKYNVKATFFVVNTSRAKLIKDEFERGHSIGIHCSTHDYYTIYSSDEAYFDDFNKMYDVIYKYTGVGTDLLRFPGGSSNTVSQISPGIMSRLTAEVENRGFTYFDWNVSSGDAGQTVETQTVYENVINGVQKHRYSIVLQHDKKGFSVDAVEDIIIWGLENGYTFLPLTKDSPTCHHKIAN